MGFIQTVAYSDSDAAIFLNNYKIGLVRSVKELAKTELYPQRAFGESGPISTAVGDKSYEIVITREQSEDAVDFSVFDSFTLRVKKAYGVVVYSRCRCKSIETERTAGEPMVEVITVSAAGRKEV